MSKEEKPENLVLVGFGKHSLADLFENVKEDDGLQNLALACTKWPPVYRREGACTVDQMSAFVNYTRFMADFINTMEDKEGVTDE
jgi:hypothetical protein